MIQSKIKKTSKKFYNKWLYKVTLKISGVSVFRTGTLESIKDFCLNGSPDLRAYSVSSKVYNNRDQIYKLADFLSQYDNEIYGKRIETNLLDLYTNDKDFYQNVFLKFNDLVTHRFEPNENSLDQLENSQTIVAKKLPHNKYRFKVYLLPHKMSGDKEGKIRFVGWLKNQVPKITCTKAVEKWFIDTNWNWDRRYVLVEDENTLLMLKLRNSDVIGRIYNYVICDK